MAKFYGKIGFTAGQVEIHPDVWEDEIVEKTYRGDVIRSQQRWQSSDQVNDNFNIDDSLSIIADLYAYENASKIRYVVFMGTKWAVQSLSINRPRLVLQLGGVYNG